MSRIEWTDKTWNVVTGCSPCSPGCAHCYAARLASGRLKHHKHYAGLAASGRWTGKVRLNMDLLDAPLRRRKPTVYFVASTGDLFHPAVPMDFIARVFGVMAGSPRHTYLLLTKRVERMRQVVEGTDKIYSPFRETVCYTAMHLQPKSTHGHYTIYTHFPLPNVWVGVSASNQDEVDRLVPLLLRTPAARRFVSLEPLLEEVEFYGGGVLAAREADEDSPVGCMACPCGKHWINMFDSTPLCGLDGVIIGCESGPGRRPMEPDWARSVRNQCSRAGVAFTLKQAVLDGQLVHLPPLDGVVHNAFPWALLKQETPE